MYQAEKLQRKTETEVRHQKDRATISKAANDKDMYDESQRKIKLLRSKYKQLSEASGLPTKMERMRVDGSKNSKIKSVDNSVKSGIIKISSPISSRKHPTGTPEGVGLFGDKLNKRQLEMLDKLPKYDSRCSVSKKSISMRDLSALTANTNVEFAMFTKGNERLIIRGNIKNVNIGPKEAKELAEQGYRWSGHTHPGISQETVLPSGDDRKILKIFNQNNSVAYNSIGKFYVFGKDEF